MAQDPHALLKEARDLESNAEGTSRWLGRYGKFKKAAEAYMKAANACRFAEQDLEAGLAFKAAARIKTDEFKGKSEDEDMTIDDAITDYEEAFKMLRKDNPKEATECLAIAINYNATKKERQRKVANQQQALAEVYETEHIEGMEPKEQLETAINTYATAAHAFRRDEAPALASKLFLKVGDLAAMAAEGEDVYKMEMYGKAIAAFEDVANSSVKNNLMKWSVKDYFLKAGICHLALSGSGLTGPGAPLTALEHYSESDPTFASTREHQFLIDLSEAVAARDQEAFINQVCLYNQLSKLDKWKTDMLLRVEGTLEEKEEENGGKVDFS